MSSNQENIPIFDSQNIPVETLGQPRPGCSDQWLRPQRYAKTERIETLAVKKYEGNGRGIIFSDLLTSGLATSKEQAQIKLKYCRRNNILFTRGNRKPQRYYPESLKSEILKKNIPIGVTGVNHFRNGLLQGKQVADHSDLDSIIIQTLEGYILPLLPRAPLHIHRMVPVFR